MHVDEPRYDMAAAGIYNLFCLGSLQHTFFLLISDLDYPAIFNLYKSTLKPKIFSVDKRIFNQHSFLFFLSLYPVYPQITRAT